MSPTSGDYVNRIQYSGTTLFVQTEEGRVIKSGSSWNYEYTLTDHLGNNRVTFDQKSGKVGEDDYYPFGLNTHRQAYAGNKYLYNKKELQEELSQYDYGARFYDPVIARWTSVDPLAEQGRRWSPYTYVFNNPMTFVDPNGMWGDYYGMNGQYYGSDGKNDNAVYAVQDGAQKGQKVADGKVTRYFDHSKVTKLAIGHDEFQKRAATVYGESSASLVNQSQELKNEMFAIASVHERNDLAYGKGNDAAEAFMDASPSERNGTKKQFAVAAEINAQTGGKI